MILYNNLRFFDKKGNDLNPQLIENINVTLSVRSEDGLGFNAILAPVVDEDGVLQYIDVINGGNGFSDTINIYVTVYDNVNQTETELVDIPGGGGDINVGVVNGAITAISIINKPTGLTYPAQQTVAALSMGYLSVNLIESEEVRILEEVEILDGGNTYIGYVYPRGGTGDVLNLSWDDDEDSDEDEFSLFSLDKDEEYAWVAKNETQSFEFADGSGDTIIARNGRYYRQIAISNADTNVIAINTMFSAKEVGVFERTLALNIYHESNDTTVQISAHMFTAETEPVDERFGNLLENFARDFPNEKEFLLRDSDIFEALTDNVLLNEKKKELLVEGDNIYPYVGSYKALINFLNWAGYDDLKIKEYWLNLDETDTNFKKYKHQNIPFDILQEGGTLNYETLPSKKFKKTNLFGLYYNINQQTDDVDQYGIPIVEDTFMFSIEEVLIKLFGLKQYLKHNFLPLNARIIDITGEGIYFERYSLNAWEDGTAITSVNAVRETDFTITPTDPYIIDLRPLGDFDYGLPTDINTTTEDVVTGVKCIAANNEYLSSPAGDYFGNTIDGFYAKIKFNKGIQIYQYSVVFNGVGISELNDAFTLAISIDGNNDYLSLGVNEVVNGDIVEIKGVGLDFEFYINSVLVSTQTPSNTSLPDVSAGELIFQKPYSPPFSNEPLTIYSYIKINTHEWTSPNWTSPTTTNSQGVVTTLHSDVSTADMILSSPASPTWNSIANTVLGYYDNINNVEVFADEPDAPIGAPVVLSMTLFDIVWNDLNSTPWDTYNADGGELSATMDFGAGTLTSIEIDNPGTGYTSDPTIEIVGGLDVGGVAATAHVELSAGGIVNVVVDTPGSGYISQPTVVLTGGFPTSTLNTWDTLGVGEYYELEWRVNGDDGVFKYAKRGRIDAMYQHTVILPYIGTYTVEMVLYDTENNQYNLFKKSAITVHAYEAEYCAYSAGGAIIKKWSDQDWTWDEAENLGYTWFNPIVKHGDWDDMQLSWDELERVDNYGNNSVYPDTVDTGLRDISERDVYAGTILNATTGTVVTQKQESALTFDAANGDYMSIPEGTVWIADINNFEINAIVSNVSNTTDGDIITRGTTGSGENGWRLRFDNTAQELKFESDFRTASADCTVAYADIPFSDPTLNILVKRNGLNIQIYINNILEFEANDATNAGGFTDINTSLPLYMGVGLTGTIHSLRVDNIKLEIEEGSGATVKASNNRIITITTSEPSLYTYINNTMWTTIPEITADGIELEVSFPLIQPILKAGDYVYFRKSGQIQRTQLLVDTELRDNLTIGIIKVAPVAIAINDSWEFLSSIGSTIVTETYDPTLVNYKPGDYITFKKPDTAYTATMLPITEPVYTVLNTNDTLTGETPLLLSGWKIDGDYTANFKPGERCGIYQFNSFDSTEFIVDDVLKTITITSADSILDQFILGFSTIELYRKNGTVVEYKQILLVTDVQESGAGPYTTTITVQEIDGDLGFYTSYPESYLTYKYNSFQSEILSTVYEDTSTILEMNINEYPASELFAPQYFDPAFTIADNWYFDYSIAQGEYSLEVVAVGSEGGYPYISLDDKDSELYMTSTGFIIDTNIFNVDRANKHIGANPTWDKLADMTWDEATNMTWDQLIFNSAVTPGFRILDITADLAEIKFNEEDPFVFQGDYSSPTLLDRLNTAVEELRNNAEGGLSGFEYFVGNDGTYIQATAKDKSPNNLGSLEFSDVVGEWTQDSSQSHTYPINNYLNQSWQDGFFGGNNVDPEWNYLYRIYKEYGVDPIGDKGWYPAANIPAAYATEDYEWYAAGVPYQKAIGGSLTWNDLNISKADLHVNNFSTVFINASRTEMPGKTKYNIELHNEDGELLVKTTSHLLIWLFTEKGKYSITVTVWDNNLNKMTSTRQNAIIVH